jgi:hypothetical protein
MCSQKVTDANTGGNWSVDAVTAKYSRLRSSLGGASGFSLEPVTHTNAEGMIWVCHIMDKVNEGIKSGDAPCVELAVEYIKDNVMGSSTGYIRGRLARSLKQAQLSDNQKHRLAETFLGQLEGQMIYQEFKEYIRLFKTIGVDPYRSRIESLLDDDKAFIRRAAVKLLS